MAYVDGETLAPRVASRTGDGDARSSGGCVASPASVALEFCSRIWTGRIGRWAFAIAGKWRRSRAHTRAMTHRARPSAKRGAPSLQVVTPLTRRLHPATHRVTLPRCPSSHASSPRGRAPHAVVFPTLPTVPTARCVSAAAPLAAVALALLAAPALSAQQPPPCVSPAHRHFDFWLGEWEVRNPQGKLAGTSRITAILGGCVVHERWSGAGGSNGESFNILDQTTGRWHQTWVDNGGLLAQFDGGLSPQGAMILEGTGRGPKGEPARSRMTFTPRPDGTIRQHWENSIDGGATWQTSFDGIYRRRTTPPPGRNSR